MSILLDALRKSENSQKPVEPPNIHSNDMPMEERSPINSGLLAVLLLLSFVVIGWLVWRQYQPETVVYRPPVDLPAGRTASVEPATDGAQQIQTMPESGEAVSESAARPRTPVETYQPSAQERIKARQEQLAKNSANATGENTADKPSAPASVVNPQGDEVSRVKPLDKAAPKKPADTTPVRPKAKKPPARTVATAKPEETYQSPEPQPIGYWELPDNVRQSIPVIKFSVLVFAEQPESRFVLINGERYQEGDNLNPSLAVAEIRRDGVIFSYQLYRFFVER